MHKVTLNLIHPCQYKSSIVIVTCVYTLVPLQLHSTFALRNIVLVKHTFVALAVAVKFISFVINGYDS